MDRAGLERGSLEPEVGERVRNRESSGHAKVLGLEAAVDSKPERRGV